MKWCLRLVLTGTLAMSGWAERAGDFQVIGPGGGGAMFNPAISPHDVNTVLISCDMTGSYLSKDGGKSWRMFNLRGTVKFFAFDPGNPQTMYAQVTGLWRTTDGGENWKLVYPKPASIKGVRMASDHADETIVAEPNVLGTIAALAVDPADSKVLYAAVDKDKNFGLYVSKDAGDNWERAGNLNESPKHLWVDPSSPKQARVVIMGGLHSVSIRSAAGVKTIPAPAGVTFSDITAGFGPKPVIYATSDQGIFVSIDSGTTWRKSTMPGTGTKVRAIATSLHHPNTAYVSYQDMKLDGKSWIGVAKTEDVGRSWKPVWKEAAIGAANIHDAWITERFGPGWGENPLMMTVADQDPEIAYGTDLGRALLTSDGGGTWNAVYSRKVAGGGYTTTGLDVTNAYGIHFDPFDAKRQFITYTDIGLFRSEDSGKSWLSSTSGVPRDWMNTTYWIEFDPQVRGRMWSVNSWTHDLPRPKMWRRTAVNTYKGGACRSEDGGVTWTKSNKGMEETAATHILLDPSSPKDARVLYVAAFGRGVYKTNDGGNSWVLKNNGITQEDPFAWRLARAADGTLYLLIARRSEDGSLGNAGDGALYQSTDAAETWRPIALPAGTNAPNGLAIDPQTPQRLYLTTWARAAGMHGDGGGIFVSEDAGKTWRQVFDGDRHIYDVTIDPRDSKILYAAGFESSAWRSADRGEHWSRIEGFNFKWGQRVIPDPADASKIYITTFGGSVWHGSVDGKARMLDIATPELEPGR